MTWPGEISRCGPELSGRLSAIQRNPDRLEALTQTLRTNLKHFSTRGNIIRRYNTKYMYGICGRVCAEEGAKAVKQRFGATKLREHEPTGGYKNAWDHSECCALVEQLGWGGGWSWVELGGVELKPRRSKNERGLCRTSSVVLEA